jgi:hypothetical protein
VRENKLVRSFKRPCVRACVRVGGKLGQLLMSARQTLPLVEEEAPFLNTYMSRSEQKTWSWIPMGLETKNYSAGEDQQQFNRPTEMVVTDRIRLAAGF